jgi:mRNA interferase RelE/StbE
MMLDLSNDARSFLERLQPKQFKQVANRIFSLQRDASPQDAKHLSGHPGYRRIDSGEFRVCYTQAGNVIKVTVVGKRNDDDVYRRLDRKN